MHDIAEDLLAELAAGRALTVVTVIRIDGSAPRALGSSMALREDGAVIGSISGGCVEGDAVELAREVAADGRTRIETFGFDDDAAFAAGLSCGGRLTVLAWRLAPDDATILAALGEAFAGRTSAVGLVLDPGDPARLGRIVPVADPPMRTSRIRREVDGADAELLCLVAPRPPRLIVVGAVDFSAALAAAGAAAGYRVTVVDARALFATRERFPAAHEVLVRWPDEYLAETAVDERTAIAVLTHSEKFDIPTLRVALEGPAGYVGAMGSRATHERRVRLLREAGVEATAIERMRSPIGLDLGASTPEETAVAIMAEILAVRSGASGRPLRETAGRIHRITVDAAVRSE